MKSIPGFIKRFAAAAGAVLVLCALVTVIFDPFYHYHGPLPGLKKVLTDKEYQCIGTLKTFDYDAVITGSSVMENTDLSVVDGIFGVHSVKAIRSFGRIADLAWLTGEALSSKNEVRLVIWNIDPGMLGAEAETSFKETGCPMYLYDRNPVNDVPYLLNKDVLFEKIPYMLAKSLSSSYDENTPYSWARWKEFSEEAALSNYERPEEVKPMLPEDDTVQELAANTELVERIVRDNPDTRFIFAYAPYSILYWDSTARSGERDLILHNAKAFAGDLLEYDNVSFYCFMEDTEVTEDLSLFMDSIHFSPDINNRMYVMINEGRYKLTSDNIDGVFEEIARYTKETVPALAAGYFGEG